MATVSRSNLTPDAVVSFVITPGTLPQLLETRTEGGPLLKCFEGSAVLVSPGNLHESTRLRIHGLMTAMCIELGIKQRGLGSTTLSLPLGMGDTAYEPDLGYYVQSQETAKPRQRPDLVVEIVVTHPAKKALQASAFLKIPEIWVIDLNRNKLTFYHLSKRGSRPGTYKPQPRSLAFPFLLSAEVLERLDDPETDDTAFFVNCQTWARTILVPRVRAEQ